ADLLIRDHHVYNALNLDGGGSTSLALRDPVTQTGKLVSNSRGASLGRAVGSNLAVFAAPPPLPAALLAITLTSTNSVILSWPAATSGWRLQQHPGPDPGHWVEALRSPELAEGRLQVVLVPQ